MTIRSINEVMIYEKNNKDTGIIRPKIEIISDWNTPDFVHIKTDSGDDFKVGAKDLMAAIKNATNIARF